ncbi:MAG TPA: RHS repeat-associated core domain-containing protein [Vicinamibacterales bacterium]
MLPFTIWSPRIDTAHQATIPSPTARETLITTPQIPGLELHLPAGTVITDEAHQVARTVSITAIPLDRTPFPMPDNATFSMFFTIQPGGAYLSTPGPIKGGWLVYPNLRHSRAGSRVQFFNYDPEDRGWYPYGMGTIAATSVVPDLKTRIYGFTGASFNDGTPTPPNGRPAGTCRCDDDGDPVSLATGIFEYEATDLVVPDVMPLVLTRSYNSQDPFGRAFGTGMSHAFGFFEHSENWHTEADLYLPDGAKIHFVQISDPSLPTEQTVFEHTTTPSVYYKARMTFWGDPISAANHGWNVTLPDGTVYVFPHAGSPLQAIRDRHGNEIRLTWASGLLQRVTSPNGRWLAFTYGAGGRVSQVSDNIGRTVGYTYDVNGNLQNVTDPEGNVTSYGWTANNQLAWVRPRNLYGTQTNLVTNEYTTAADAPTPVGWVKKQTHADGGVYQFAYTVSNGKSTSTDVTDPRGYVRRVTFNGAGYALSDTRAWGLPGALTTTSERPGTGNFVTTSTDSLLAKTAYVRDGYGDVTSVTRCLPNQDPCTDASPGSLTTRYTYDTRFQQVATVTDPLNHSTMYGYDDARNLTSVTDPLQHQSTFGYNGQGRMTSMIDALQHTTTFEYTAGDLTTITDPLTRVTRRFTDAGGRVLSATDPLGRTIRYTYDRKNQVRSTTDALGGYTVLAYFPDGQLQNVTDANQHTTSYTYDAMGRLASRTDPMQRRETFTYDLNGNPNVWTDRKGQLTTQTYDVLDRLHQIQYADTSTITYTYDNRSRVTQIDDNASGSNQSIMRTYDDFDRLLSELTPQGSIGYTYDVAGRRGTMTVTGQPQIGYEYDNADRLTAVTRDTLRVSIDYDDAGRRSMLTLPNGVVTQYGYDNSNEIVSIAYNNGPTPIGTLTYSYDRDGRRTQISGTWARTALPQSIATTAYDASNELNTWGTQTRHYDANGNLASDGLKSYSWDARNRLVSLTGEVPASFSYDALDRRVAVGLAGTATTLLYDGDDIATTSALGTTTSLLGGDKVDDWLASVGPGGSEALITDVVGSTVATWNSSGAPGSQYVYEPFGNTTATATDSAMRSIQFTGRENDGIGLYFFRARYLDVQAGRFISEDPIGMDGGINEYAYAGDDPINLVDPFGLCAPDECDDLLAEILNLAAEVSRRFQQYDRPRRYLPLQGPMSREGHIKQIADKQKYLTKQMRKYDDMKCPKPIPLPVLELATRPLPVLTPTPPIVLPSPDPKLVGAGLTGALILRIIIIGVLAGG